MFKRSAIIFSLLVVFIFQLIGYGAVKVYAAGEIIFDAPKETHLIPDIYNVRYRILNADAPKTIKLSYKDNTNKTAEVNVTPIVSKDPSTSYVTQIQNLGEGPNTITLTVVSVTNKTYTASVNVTVTAKKTNIVNQAINVEPYTNDKNKFKNMFKLENAIMASERGVAPKDNAFISNFVDILFEEAQTENVRPDVVFSQIVLETGWLTYGGDVSVSQYNFGGIGAIGGGVKGNLFESVREGIRVNVQHLVGYATKTPTVNPVVDPRFYYMERGIAPYVEYLGYYENPVSKGWAMAAQYGPKLLGLMDRLSKASAVAFTAQAGPIEISEFNVSPITLAGTNNIDKNYATYFAKGNPVRLAVATNSYTEHSFKVTNKTTGKVTDFPYTTNGAVIFTPDTDGEYLFEVFVRPAGSTAGFLKTQQKSVIVGVIPDEIKYKDVDPRIGTVTLSPAPYVTGRAISLTISGLTSDEIAANEYKLDVRYNGAVTNISPWSQTKTYSFSPTAEGQYTFVLSSRNKYSLVKDTKYTQEFIVDVKNDASKADLITSISAATAPFLLGKELNITGIPVNQTAIKPEYILAEKIGTVETIISSWQATPVFKYLPKKSGPVTLKVYARDSVTKPLSYQDEAALDITVVNVPAKLEKVVVTPAPYTVGTPITFTATPLGDAGLINEYSLQEYRNGQFYRTISDYNANPVRSFTPDRVGDYEVLMTVRDKYLKSNVYSDSISFKFTVGSKTQPLTGLKITGTPYTPGKKLIVEGVLDATSSSLYDYALYTKSGTSDTLVSAWNTTGKFEYTPTASGTITLSVKYRSKVGAKVMGEKTQSITVMNATGAITNLVSNNQLNMGLPSTLTATVATTHLNLLDYKLQKVVGTVVTDISAWQSSPVFNYTPTEGGTLYLRVTSKWRGTNTVATTFNKTFTVAKSTVVASMKYVTVTPGPYYTNKLMTVTAVPDTGTELMGEYRALVNPGSGFVPVTDWSTSKTMTFAPKYAGSTIRIRVESRNRLTKVYSDAEGFIISVLPAPVVTPPTTTTTPITTAPKTTTPSTTTPVVVAPVVGAPYNLVVDVKGYVNAADAKNRVNAVKTMTKGTYYVYKIFDGMVNISTVKGAPGAWINPADNKSGTVTPPTTTTPVVTTTPKTTTPVVTTTPKTTTPVTTSPVIVTPVVGAAYTLVVDVKGYVNAADAKNRVNAVKTMTKGTYYVYKIFDGMVNISTVKGAPGAWINPADNKSATVTPPYTTTPVVTTPPTTTTPRTPTPVTTTSPVTTPTVTLPSVGGLYTVVTEIKGYVNAADAKNRVNAVKTFAKGNYYVYKIFDGMVNISTVKGTPGAWINPADNKSATVVQPIVVDPIAPKLPVEGGLYTLIKDIPGYMNAANAQSKVMPVTTVSKGNYFVFRIYNGMLNVSKASGSPGSWINPADNR